MPSAESEHHGHVFARAVDGAIDAAVAIRDTLNTIQVIEYRQKMLMERLVALTQAYGDMYRSAAKGVAVEAAEAAINVEAGASTATMASEECDTKALPIHELGAMTPVIEAFAPLLHAAAASAAGAGMLASPTPSSGIPATRHGGASSSTSAAAAQRMASVQMISSVAAELKTLREAIRAVEDELEALGTTRAELVSALVVI